MVAALVDTSRHELLFAPEMGRNPLDEPRLMVTRARARRRAVEPLHPRLVRDDRTDATGALVQRAILQYVLGGVSRADLAYRYGWSETSLQSILRGGTHAAYGRPVLAWLSSLGIGTRRGWAGAARQREIVAAQRAVMAHALDALQGGATPADELTTALWLLSRDWSQER